MRSIFLAATLLSAFATLAAAADLPMPQGPVILRISGDIEHTNIDGAAHFDLPMMEAMAKRQTVIETPWYSGETSFEGPLISALMKAVGANGDTLRVVALNDYASEIPRSDVEDYPVILATRINGDVISIRDKGPAFVIYPFDIAPELYNEMIFGRSVWQVGAIEVY